MIEIFDDRVHISNPGGLPKGLSPSKFGTLSISRNPLIASLLHRVGYIEKMGTGISRIKNALAIAGDPDPVFKFDSFFTVTFRRTPLRPISAKEQGHTTQETTQEQGKTTQKVLSLIKTNSHITRNELAIKLGITSDGVKYHLRNLTKAGLLQHVGATRKGYWQIIKRDK